MPYSASSVAATQRISTASVQLASRSACSRPDGWSAGVAAEPAAQLVGGERGWPRSRPSGARPGRARRGQPEGLQPDHAHPGGQGGQPVAVDVHDAAVEHRPGIHRRGVHRPSGGRGDRLGASARRRRGSAGTASPRDTRRPPLPASPRFPRRHRSPAGRVPRAPTSLWVTATPPHLPNCRGAHRTVGAERGVRWAGRTQDHRQGHPWARAALGDDVVDATEVPPAASARAEQAGEPDVLRAAAIEESEPVLRLATSTRPQRRWNQRG